MEKCAMQLLSEHSHTVLQLSSRKIGSHEYHHCRGSLNLAPALLPFRRPNGDGRRRSFPSRFITSSHMVNERMTSAQTPRARGPGCGLVGARKLLFLGGSSGGRFFSRGFSASSSGGDEGPGEREEVTESQGPVASFKEEFLADVESMNKFVQEKMAELNNSAQRIRLKAVDSAFNEAKYLSGWNKIELWKDVASWSLARWAVALIAVSVAVAALWGGVSAIRILRAKGQGSVAAEQFLELAIPEPTPRNVRRILESQWRDKVPEGITISRLKQKPDGTFEKDESFIGETAWRDSDKGKDGEEDVSLLLEGEEGQGGAVKATSWRERMDKWLDILQEEAAKEKVEDGLSRYEIKYDKERLKADAAIERAKESRGNEAARPVARGWWKLRPAMPYSWLLQKLRLNEVQSAVFSEDLRRLFITMRDGFPSEFVVNIPVDPYLPSMLIANSVKVGMLPRSILYAFRPLVILLPSVLLLYVLVKLYTAVRAEIEQKAYDYINMDRNQLFLPDSEGQKISFDDVILGEGVWQVLKEIMSYMEDPMRYHSKGAKLPRGILLSGPPGTGKTMLARAMARECKLPFVFAAGSDFVNSEKETAFRKLEKIFFTTRANAPSILFIDEIDALAGNALVEDPDKFDIFSTFLEQLDAEVEHTEVDRFSMRQAFILVTATNRPDDLHPSLLMAGRIDREVRIGLPSEEQRVAIFSVHSRNRLLDSDVDFSKLAFRTVGYSGADIRNLINEAGILAVRQGKAVISQADVEAALDKSLFESMGMALTDEEIVSLYSQVPEATRRLLAVHEAGHILLAHLFPQFDSHAFTQLIPGGDETAMSLFFPREWMLEMGGTTVGYLRMKMVVAHGGMCAERIVFGDDISDAGQDDLHTLSNIARELANSDLSPFGIMPITMHPVMQSLEDDPLIPEEWSRPGTQVATISVEMSERFTREVNKHIDQTEKVAMAALRENQHILLKLADVLFEKYRINGWETEKLVQSMNPSMLPDYMAENCSAPGYEERGSLPTLERPGRYDYLDIYPAPLHRC